MSTLDPFNLLQQQEHTPIPVAPTIPPKPQAAVPPNGPTGFWNRINQVGVGAVNTLKLQAAREARGASAAVRMQVAARTNNSKAFQNANKSAQANASTTDAAGKLLGKTPKAVVQVGKSLVKPAADLGKELAYVPKAAYREAQNKPITDVQKSAFGTTNSGSIAKKIVGNTAGTAALIAGGGSTKELLESKEALAAGLAKNTAAGAVGNASSTLANNSKAKGKDLIKSAEGGAVFGAATALLGAVGGKLASNAKAIIGKDKAVNSLVTNSKTASAQDFAKRLDSLGQGYKKEAATATDKAVVATKYKTAVKELIADHKNGTTSPAVAEAVDKLSSTPAHKAVTESMAAEATRTPEASLSQNISRPTSESIPHEPLVNTNKEAATGVGAKLQSKGAGSINPELGAARQGNTDFASAIRRISSGDALANTHANQAADKFSTLFDQYAKTGGTKEKFIQDVESGKLGSQAHDFWVQHYKQLGSSLEGAGVLKNGARDSSYVPRIAQFGDKSSGSMGGLKKTGGFAKGRAQESVGDLGEPTGDLYKTHGEFKSAVEAQGGKVQDNPVEILRSSTAQRLQAINHSEGLAQLDKTAMRDGRPATVTFDQKSGLPPGYRDYNTSVLPGRAVHPEAVKGVNALINSGIKKGGVEGVLGSINSTAKKFITLNGLVHGKNFVLASIRENGLRGTATAFKDYSEEDINRAVGHGFVPSRSGVSNVFDEANNGRGALGRATSTLGKLYNKQQKLLFEGFGDKLGMSTYLKTEKGLISKGLSKDEAGKIAADTANRVIFSQRSTETSPALREASRVAFFAGKYFQSTLATGGKALGLSKNNVLSDAAQKVEQRQAAKNVARGFTYLFGAAQAINYATTGHSTFQNKDSKISPVFHVDPTTGKEYHITNFYGQLGDLLHMAGNPVKEVTGKASPVIQEGAKILTNTDPFKGTPIRNTNASGARQAVEVFANILENMVTPLGFQTSQMNQVFGKGGQPGKVTATKLLGYGTSTTDQNQMEKDISERHYATLPQGQGEQKSQQLTTLEAAARNDMSKGNANSKNVQAVKSQLSPTAFKKFQKTGADTQVQSYFDSLPNDQKLQIIDKYSPAQLKEIDTSSLVKSLVSSSAKTSIESLQSKGYSPQKINQLLQKVGYQQSQLQQIKADAKKQAAATSRASRGKPKFVNPLLK